jgi:hypothetical protein
LQLSTPALYGSLGAQAWEKKNLILSRAKSSKRRATIKHSCGYDEEPATPRLVDHRRHHQKPNDMPDLCAENTHQEQRMSEGYMPKPPGKKEADKKT